MKLLDNLNAAQKEAAMYFSSPLCILAGAGAGKTRVITYRIAHLILDLGVDPKKIMGVTFTNKAASEMRERLEGLVPDCFWHVQHDRCCVGCARLVCCVRCVVWEQKL